MRQVESPAFSLMKRLLDKDVAFKAKSNLSIALDAKPWDGMDSLDAFINKKIASKYQVVTENTKAAKLLGCKEYKASSRAAR